MDAAADRWRFEGMGYAGDEVAAGRTRGFDLTEVRRQGLEPIGVDTSGRAAFGYRDRSANRISSSGQTMRGDS